MEELQKISLLATTLRTESPLIFLDRSDSASRVLATAHVFQKSALYQLADDSPKPLPRKPVVSWSPQERTNKEQQTSISHMFSALLSGWRFKNNNNNNNNNNNSSSCSVLLFAFFNTMCLNMFLFCLTRNFYH